MRSRASLCPPLTFTEAYRDHYEEFVAEPAPAESRGGTLLVRPRRRGDAA